MDSSSESSHGHIGEKLCTIAEESLESARDFVRQEKQNTETMICPKKSATFGNATDLKRNTGYHLYRSKSGKNSKSDYQIRMQNVPRKRSLLVEMGSRLKLFPNGSIVSLSHHPIDRIPKAHSLNSFENASCTSSRIPSACSGHKKSRVKISPRGVGSIVSLNQVECGLGNASPSQLGMLCSHCSTQDIPCSKAAHIQQSGGTRSCSLLSLSPSSSPSAPLCRICHCAYPIDPLDPLISPCRCSGSLQHVHVSCLMHWLDISSRKLHRPAICELCLYKYRRRRVLKYRELQLPECARGDLRYYFLLMIALILMLTSAAVTIFCFQMEKKYVLTPLIQEKLMIAVASPAVAHTPGGSPSVEQLPTGASSQINDVENLLSTITLVSAILFFFSFFLAMYAHIKSGQSICGYIRGCWSSNLEWSIEEYRMSRDTQYLAKLEELRRKLNEKQTKKCSAEEVEPLRSAVIAIE